MQIMDVLWEDGNPLSRSDFLDRAEEKSWKDSSVHILLNGLLRKGIIREAGIVKRTKTYGRTFLPTMTREEYFATTTFSHPHKPDMTGLIQALLERPEADAAALKDIQALVEQRIQTLEKK